MARAASGKGLDDAAGFLPLEPEDYLGHRERLRERFLAGGNDALADYELLELLLFMAIPRRDVKPYAKRLISRFGSFHGVLAADAAALQSVKGIGAPTAAAIKAIHAAALRFAREAIIDRPLMGTWQQVIDYCRAAMAHNEIEELRVLYLDAKNGLLHEERLQTGTVNHTAVYPREVVKRALERGAVSIVMVHNHPSGDPTPSRADIEMTKEVAKAAAALGITLHDHLIVARERHASLKGLGLI